ncbi:agenet-like domain, Agenet domain [Artemisia annua]|uniref:Agenet-like domain, Agenet domain n=1 Tax=Artemisia annua TaxID=35608 RepID=A0A2U1MFD3_ARTAN|nr:agenet-like domain, Agenet domain [Artemisia annua]
MVERRSPGQQSKSRRSPEKEVADYHSVTGVLIFFYFYCRSLAYYGVSVYFDGDPKSTAPNAVSNFRKKTTRLIFRVCQKVEISFEENRLCGVWFPAVVVEDLGGKLLLVEYKCAWINGGEKLHRVSVDHHHIRPSLTKFKDISFGSLDKVDVFYDFGWWSGVVTRNLAYSRYLVYFKNTNKVKDLGHRELRSYAEWKDDKWLTPYEVSNVI